MQGTVQYICHMSPELDLENAKAQMRKGTLEFCILLIVGRGEAYSSDILTTLKEHDLLVVEGTLYPLLSRLRHSGLVSYEWRESKSGPPRKYYSLTKKGRATLDDLITSWNSLNTCISSLISSHA